MSENGLFSELVSLTSKNCAH